MQLKNCNCGGKARYRYREPYHWVECRNKTCPYNMRTRYYHDIYKTEDPAAKQRAEEEWNRMVSDK